MTKKEVQSMTTDGIIIAIYYMGIVMSGGRQTKKQDKELLLYCKELQARGIVADGYALFTEMCK